MPDVLGREKDIRYSSRTRYTTDLYKQVQVEPFADFTSIDAVLVLVRKPEAK